MIHNLEVIGDACRNILREHAEFAASHPEARWKSPSEMRNALTHGHFDIDLAWTWTTLQADLPALEAQIRTLLTQLDQSPPDAAPSTP